MINNAYFLGSSTIVIIKNNKTNAQAFLFKTYFFISILVIL